MTRQPPCIPCGGGIHTQCTGISSSTRGACGCEDETCAGHGVPRPGEHGGDNHTCWPGCYGWRGL